MSAGKALLKPTNRIWVVVIEPRDPLAIRYVAKFMHQTCLLAQFQHTAQEDSDDETGDPTEVMEQSPEDAGYSPPLAPTFEDGENLTQLFEYTLPDWAQAHARPDAR
ncbi:hypothetical protein PENANT_c096G05100 [Penicillium antarcticum]|uniref:Uncharacterized protein n=1 Tax=Penicillium antarcticum TaxID=416450 RepID=A0A1V6PM29_9EURO|nr:hypothetical protein PENANT_c096G05100 [Penicillium antarcticum]